MNSVTVHSSQPSFTASHFRCWLKSTFYHLWKVSNLNNLFHYIILFCRLIYINAGNSICRFAFSSFFPLLLIQNLWHLHKHNSLYRIFHLCVLHIHKKSSLRFTYIYIKYTLNVRYDWLPRPFLAMNHLCELPLLFLCAHREGFTTSYRKWMNGCVLVAAFDLYMFTTMFCLTWCFCTWTLN